MRILTDNMCYNEYPNHEGNFYCRQDIDCDTCFFFVDTPFHFACNHNFYTYIYILISLIYNSIDGVITWVYVRKSEENKQSKKSIMTS